jgi:hypothetical protein
MFGFNINLGLPEFILNLAFKLFKTQGEIMPKKMNYKRLTYRTLSLVVIGLAPILLYGSAAHARLIQYIDLKQEI